MAYVGNPVDTQNTFQSLQGKRFNGDGSTTNFTLDVAPGSTLDIEVFVGNVRQDPNSAYTSSGTTLSFTGAPPSGTNNIYVVHQAKSVGTIDVPDSSVNSDKLTGNLVTPGTLDVNGQELILDADADTSITADTDDQIDVKIAGADDFKFTANNFNILSGSTLTVDSGATITNSGTANGFGTHVKLFTDTSPSGGSVAIGSSYITSTYKAYLLRIQNLSSDSDNWRLLLRHSTDNNSSSINSVTDSYYQSANSSHGSSTYSNNAVENNLSAYLSHDDIGNGSNEGLNGFAYLFIDTTKPKHGTFKFTHTNSNRIYMYQGAYYVDSNDTVNAISLLPSGGSFDAGLIELYGII